MYYAFLLIILEWNDSYVLSQWIATSIVFLQKSMSVQNTHVRALSMALYIKHYILYCDKLLFMNTLEETITTKFVFRVVSYQSIHLLI